MAISDVPMSTSPGSGPTRRTSWRPRPVSSDCRWWSHRTAKTVLVTGIDGFAGSHLCELLMRRRHTVHGTIRRGPPDPRSGLPAPGNTHQAHLLDPAPVRALVRPAQP